ncbi:hypothetical protein K8T06_03645 [bacterium]|nr:hypothetical protein [bacterium]
MTDYSESKWLFVSSAKGIQSYIFKVNKLKQIIGATELIESLGGKIKDTLQELGSVENTDYRVIQLAGGTARLLFFNEAHGRDLAEIWPLIVRKLAPGLQVVQALVPVTEDGFVAALKESETVLRANRNLFQPDLPPAQPVTARNHQTGLPVIENKSGKYLDQESFEKLSDNIQKQEKLLERIEMPDVWFNRQWTRDFGEIAPEQHYMAVIHADGNGLGRHLLEMGNKLAGKSDKEALDVYERFSKAIEHSTKSAFVSAIKPVMDDFPQGEIPVRVIVCAGDDLTVVMPAKYALEFSKTFLTEFEKGFTREVEKEEVLKDFKLTACAGIVFINAKFPFVHAYELADSLCKYTKDKVDRKCSALSWYRVTTSGLSTYKDILERELTVGKFRSDGTEESPTELSMMPYILESNGTFDLADISKLEELKNVIKKLPRGSIRELISAMYISRSSAEAAYDRIAQVARDKEKTKESFDDFEKILLSVGKRADQIHPLWLQDKEKKVYRTLLMDVIELRSATREKEGE